MTNKKRLTKRSDRFVSLFFEFVVKIWQPFSKLYRHFRYEIQSFFFKFSDLPEEKELMS